MSVTPRIRAEALEDSGRVNEDGLDVEISVFDVCALVLLLPVIDSREEEFLEAERGVLFRELEDAESLINLLAADEVSNELHLAGRSGTVA